MRFEQLTDKILGTFYGVYNELGHGFLESVYESAMVIALRENGLSVEQQVAVPVWFRGNKIGTFAVDLIVDNTVILELKAVRSIDPSHEAQLLHYLRSTPIEVGLLLNFGVKPEVKRRIYDNDRKNIRVDP